MNIYISVDMEGCAGVLHREQTNPKGYDYELARALMTGEANAAVEGAFDAGAKRVVVSDGHGGNGMRNLLPEALDERAEVVQGSPRRLGQLEGIDDPEGFDGLLMIGYHTRHGRAGVLSHTTNGQAIAHLWIGDVLVGEMGLNARLAGWFGVPTLLATGDDRTVAEAEADCPGCHTVAVKHALGRYAARSLHPARARAAIRAGAVAALSRREEVAPVRVEGPVRVRIRFKESGSAESAARQLGAELTDDDTVDFEAPDMAVAYAAYSAAVELWKPAWGEWIGR